MKSTLIMLAQLQALDTKLRAAASARDAVLNRQRGLKADADKARAEFKAASVRTDELEKEKRAREGELQMEREKLRKWEGRLEELRNSREFAALNREVEATKRANNDTTEAIASLVVSIEEQAKKLKDAEARVAATEKALADDAPVTQADLDAHDATNTGQKDERARLAAKLPANIMKKYDQLLTKRQGLAVVAARDGVCKGCNMNVPAQIFIRIQKGESLETCQACQRILFHESILERDGTAGAAAATN